MPRPLDLLRTKSVEQPLRDSEESEHSLRRELGPLQLTLIGIGMIVGTGIFVLTGVPNVDARILNSGSLNIGLATRRSISTKATGRRRS